MWHRMEVVPRTALSSVLTRRRDPLKKRLAVERAFSRLKGQRSLNSITVRGQRKVTAHCYLALIAMQAR